MKPKFTTYSITQRKGMEGRGDMEDYWEIPDPIKIVQETSEREKYIQDLKDSGEYGKDYEMKISVQQDDILDNIKINANTTYRMEIIDFSK